MASAASSLPESSSGAAGAASTVSDCELLQLLEEFSADDIADVVRAIDADVSESELLTPTSSASSSTSSSLVSDINSSTAASNGTAVSALTIVGRGSAASAHRVSHNKKARAAATGDQSKPKPKRRNDPNKARNQRKEELIYLHKKVTELEIQLSEVKRNATTTEITAQQMGANANTKQARSVARRDSASELSLVVPSRRTVVKSRAPSLIGNTSFAAAARVWEELAERQRSLRMQSERENIRLKLVLETQLKIARSLEKVLLKPASTREIEKSILGTSYSPSHPTSIVPQLIPDRSDAVIFDELLAGVHHSYAEIDAVFEANGLARMETTHKDARMRRDPSGNMVMEIFANKVLPFGIHETGDAVWHHFVFGKEKVPNRFHTENAPKVFLPSISSYLKNFGLEVHAQHKSANFRVKQVLQQHVEGDERVVIVWQALIDPVTFSDDPLLPNDVGFIEKGYIIMKRPPSMPGNLTLLQTCHIITPNLRQRTRDGYDCSNTNLNSMGGEDGFARVGALTDFVLSATAANISTSYQIIENVLLEQSLKNKSSDGSDTSASEWSPVPRFD